MKLKNIFDKNLQEKKEGLNKLLEIMLFSAKNIFSEDFLIFSPQHFLHIKLFCKVTSGMERAPGKKLFSPIFFGRNNSFGWVKFKKVCPKLDVGYTWIYLTGENLSSI